MIRKWSWLLVVLVLVGCGSGRPPAAVLIGHVAPLTGPDRDSGQSALRGIQLAVQQANQDEGDGIGAQVVVFHADARPTHDSFTAEALRLAQVNQVMALLGGRTAEQVSGLDQGQVLVVSPAGFGDPTPNGSVFLTGVTPDQQGKLLAQVALQKLPRPASPKGVVGVLGASTTGGGAAQTVVGLAANKLLPAGRIFVLLDQRREESALAAAAFRKALAASGDSAPPQTRRYRQDKELEELAADLAGEHPRAVFLAGAVEAVGKCRRAWKGPPCPILFAGPEGSQKELLANPQTADNLFLVTAWVPGAATAANRDFLKQYRAAFQNEEPDVHAALAYDDAQLLCEALRQCNKIFTSRQILGKLGEVKDFPGLTGKVSFDGERVLRRPAFVVQLRAGQPVVVSGKW